MVTEILAYEFHWLSNINVFFNDDALVFQEVAKVFDLLFPFLWEFIDELLFDSFKARNDFDMFLLYSWIHWHHSWSNGCLGCQFFDYMILRTSNHSCNSLLMSDFIGEDNLHLGASACFFDLYLILNLDWLVREVFSDDFLSHSAYNWLDVGGHGLFSHNCKLGFGLFFFFGGCGCSFDNGCC